jgi:outer membrane protein OmpA-like peptidoglycan-associated protein
MDGITGETGDTAAWTETPVCPLCDSGALDLGLVPLECASVEGAGCSCGGCSPPEPRCGVDGVAGGGRDSGGEWEGSPSVCGTAAPRVPALLGLLLVLLVLLVRRRDVRALLALCALTAAEARAVDVDRMAYSDGRGWAALVDGDPGRPWQARAALSTAMLSRPLVARYADGDVFPLVGFASTAALGASLTLDPRIRVGLVLPVHPVVLDGAGNSALMTPGDASFSLAVPTSGPDARVQGTWQVGGEVPSGDPTRFLGGLGSVHGTLAGRVAMGARGSLGGQLGLRLRPDERLSATRWGNAVEYGLAGALRPLTSLEVALEGFGSLGLRDDTRASLPLEWLATARWPAESGASLRLGAGGGVGRGLGNPRVRALLALELASASGKDTDGDGYLDLRDLCRERPEDRDRFRDLDGCPDLDDDKDGIVDVEDACRLKPETVNGWRDPDGCPDARAELIVEVGPASVEAAEVHIEGQPPFTTLPGLAQTLVMDPGLVRMEVTAEGFAPQHLVQTVGEGPTRLRVQLEALPHGALTVRVRDEAGAPVPAEVRVAAQQEAGVEAEARSLQAPQGEVVVPLAAGPVAVVASAAGFVERRVLAQAPEEGSVEVEIVLRRTGIALVGREIVVGDHVRFELDRADLAPDAAAALDVLARWLREHPEIELLRVEGHADALGSPRYNLELSQRRAEAVVAALVARGIAKERLVALGSGESVRLSEPGSDRVVDFLVLVWDETPREERP